MKKTISLVSLLVLTVLCFTMLTSCLEKKNSITGSYIELNGEIADLAQGPVIKRGEPLPFELSDFVIITEYSDGSRVRNPIPSDKITVTVYYFEGEERVEYGSTLPSDPQISQWDIYFYYNDGEQWIDATYTFFIVSENFGE